MGIPKRGDGCPKEDIPRGGCLSAGIPLGWQLDGVILASHGSTFSITGAGRDESAVVHTAQRVPDPRDAAPLLRAALLSVVPTDEEYHPRLDMMDTSPSGLGAAHPPVLSTR